jgi:hypothetical protein
MWKFKHDFKVTRPFFLTDIPNYHISEKEKALVANFPPLIQRFLLWRRWVLILLIVPYIGTFSGMLATVILQLQDLSLCEASLTPWQQATCFRGQALTYVLVIQLFQLLVYIVSFILICVALGKWRKYKASRRLVIASWTIAFIFPFLAFFYPWANLVVPYDGTPTGLTNSMFVRSLYSTEAFKALGPSSLSMFPGVVHACGIVKAMFPHNIIIGWLYRVLPLLYTPVLMAYACILSQIAGDNFIIGALIALAAAELSTFVFGKKLTKAYSKSNDFIHVLLPRVWLKRVLLLIFVAFVLVFVITNDFAKRYDLVQPIDVYRFVIDFISKYLLNAVLFTDMLLGILVSAEKESLRKPEAEQVFRENVRQAFALYGHSAADYASGSDAPNDVQMQEFGGVDEEVVE